MKKQWNCRTPDSISYTERYRVYPHTLKWETTYHHVLVSIANLTFQFKRPLWIHNKKLSVCDKSSVDSSNRPQQMPITSYTFNFNIDQVFHSLSQDSTVTVNWTLYTKSIRIFSMLMCISWFFSRTPAELFLCFMCLFSHFGSWGTTRKWFYFVNHPTHNTILTSLDTGPSPLNPHIGFLTPFV